MSDEANMDNSPETEGAVESGEPIFDRSALELKVEEGLQALFNEGDEDNASEEASEADEKPTDEEDEGSEDGETVEDSDAGDEPQEPQGAAPKGPTLPDAHKRSLKAYGWTDEEIQEALNSSGSESFRNTAARIHKNRNDETLAYANKGRQLREQNNSESTPVKPQKQETSSTGFKPIDRDAMVEKYGNEDIIDEILGAVNPLITKINDYIPQLQEGLQTSQQAHQQNLARQIDEFFKGPSLAPYSAIYGKSFKELSDQQSENRNKVLELADAIVIGAQAQGRQLNVDDALLLAHDVVASDFKETVARKQIKQTVQRRSRGTVAKPSHSGGTLGGEKPLNRDELEKVTAKRMKAVFR